MELKVLLPESKNSLSAKIRSFAFYTYKGSRRLSAWGGHANQAAGDT
jgi:hypothetical protein